MQWSTPPKWCKVINIVCLHKNTKWYKQLVSRFFFFHWKNGENLYKGVQDTWVNCILHSHCQNAQSGISLLSLTCQTLPHCLYVFFRGFINLNECWYQSYWEQNCAEPITWHGWCVWEQTNKYKLLTFQMLWYQLTVVTVNYRLDWTRKNGQVLPGVR